MKFKISSIAVAVMLGNTAVAEEMADIERVTVTGQYLSINESNSVKTPTPVIDVPQSLSIISAEEMTLRNINSVGQIIDYTPGVNTTQGEGHRDAVVFRGVRSTADFYLDGNRDDVQYYRSLYNIEQVEILRGPNALLFGRGGTGGILNRVSKKAELNQAFTGFQTSLNSFGGYDGQIDTNFTTGDDSAVRINAMIEHLENHRDFYDGDRYGFNPTARFSLSDKTLLDVSYEYINHERFIDRGIPTGTDGRPVEALEDIVFGDPENNYHELEAHVFRANLQHQFTDGVKGNFNAFYGDYDKVYSNFYATDYNKGSRTVELDGYIDSTVRDNLILSGNLIAEFDSGSIGHTVIIGSEYIATNSDQNRFNPLFSTTGNDRERFLVEDTLNFRGMSGVNRDGLNFTVGFDSINDDTRVDLDVLSIYVQDEIEISEHLDVVIGARFDRFDIEVFNAVAMDTRSRTDNEISPRAGVIFKPRENLSLYASYSESFLPRSGEQFTDINGSKNQLEPDTYSNQEVGIKWDINDAISFTAAVFENEQSSPQVADNDPATLDVIDQEISGFEVQLNGYLTDDWLMTVNYSNLDGEIVDRTGPTGRTPRELPENTFSVWSTYQVNDVFGFGIGATYQGESFIDNGNNAVLPSYTRVDAGLFYDISDTMRVQLNVENLTDELYFPNSHSTHQATVAAPLNATLTLVGNF
ncbi:TonB-dependent receptor [Aestuariibacter salexigens]|uniref:TonB-dependent receptor n=1 Tax=Aestuariibacter salexigens TaxID=226010 RepID=UPI0004257CD8|nr:TonB-dependent siderophore receptor [Aestuariibacter salexigens]